MIAEEISRFFYTFDYISILLDPPTHYVRKRKHLQITVVSFVDFCPNLLHKYFGFIAKTVAVLKLGKVANYLYRRPKKA